jgi:hypothetical protein
MQPVKAQHLKNIMMHTAIPGLGNCDAAAN